MKTSQLKELIRELIKTELEEINTTGGGSSVSSGNGMGYMTPKAFKKKKTKSGYMGYSELK